MRSREETVTAQNERGRVKREKSTKYIYGETKHNGGYMYVAGGLNARAPLYLSQRQYAPRRGHGRRRHRRGRGGGGGVPHLEESVTEFGEAAWCTPLKAMTAAVTA